MDLIHAELLATGARIAPLTTLDEIAAFFHAAAAVGQAAPARATAIAQRLALVDIIAQIIAARNYVSYYQNHIWIIASYYETLCIIAQLL